MLMHHNGDSYYNNKIQNFAQNFDLFLLLRFPEYSTNMLKYFTQKRL